MITDLSAIDAARAAIESTTDRSALILKHSTRCGASAHAWSEFQAFVRENPDVGVDCFRVLVVEDRPVSLAIADELRVTHESPQLILIRDGRAVWHTSHFGIRSAAILEALDAADAGNGH